MLVTATIDSDQLPEKDSEGRNAAKKRETAGILIENNTYAATAASGNECLTKPNQVSILIALF